MKKAKSNPDLDLLRVLILEDNPADAELVERELLQAGINFTSLLVEGKREYSKALVDFQPQVILSDFKLPDFDGLAALEITRRLAPDIPFIFVSGSIGEEQAIETLALGAADYILKDNLQRLGPAVKKVVEAACLKLEKKKSDEELLHHIDELRLLAEAADCFVNINDLDKIYEYLATVIVDLSGADYLILSLYDEKLQAIRPKIATGFEPFRETLSRRFQFDPMQMVFYFKDMRADDFNDFVSRKLLPVRNSLYGLSNRKIPRPLCRTIEKLLGIDAMFSMGFSWENQLYGGLTVLFKKNNELKNHAQIEALLNQAAVSIKRLLAEKSLRASEEHLRQSEEYYRTLVETSPDAIIIIDGGGRITFASQKAIQFFGVPSQTTLKGIPLLDFVEPEEVPIVQERLVEILSGRALPETSEYRLQRHDLRPFWGEMSSAPLQDTAGRNIGLLLVCRDVSERKQTELQIQYQANLLANVSDAIFATDRKFNIQYWNTAAEKQYGWTAAEVLGNHFPKFIQPQYPGDSRTVIIKKIVREGFWNGEILHNRRNGALFPVQVTISEVRNAEDKIIGHITINRDITKRKEAEEAFLREKAFLDQLVESAPEAIVLAENNGQILRVNSEFEKMFGYSAKEAIGRLIDDLVVPPKYRREATDVTQTVAHGEKFSLETVRRRKDGALLHVSLVGSPIIIGGEQVAAYGIYRDISERKQAEEQIRAALKEKEVLLQEIHHRVKNNLQIISGLLTLQADQAAGKSLGEIFRESQDRIRSIALIHEKLYRSHNLAEIAFDEYLRALTENLLISQGVVAGRITVKYEMEPIQFTIEKAIPLGLIVNELVTNALKHAFPAGQQGEIRIGLHGYKGAKSYVLKTDSGTPHSTPTCELIVADNGVGLPAGQVPEMEKTLGMNLVSMLARQIQAELKIKTGPGTEFRLLFPGLPANHDSQDKDHDG